MTTIEGAREAVRDADPSSDRRRVSGGLYLIERAHRGRELAWYAATVLAAVVVALVAVLLADRFYFADDTQAGAWPIWVSIGRSLREGTLPFFEPAHWMAGNIAAEGQWGLFNPLIWCIGLFAAAVPNGVIAATFIKVAFLALGAGGVFLVARSYGAERGWASAVGLLVSCAGFTVYIDAASWVTGLFVSSLLPYVWWGLRLTGRGGKNVLWMFVPGYALITIGYVHGTIILVATIVGLILEAMLVRDPRAAWRTLGSGVLLGLVALATYLPGVLAAPVTSRSSTFIENINFMSPDLSGLAASAAPTGRVWMTGFWTPPAMAPLLYIAWLLPALFLVDWRRIRPLLRELTAPLFVGAVAISFVLGPSEVGPLRFPARLLPYVALTVLLLTGILLSRLRKPLTRAGLAALIVWTIVSALFAFADAPGFRSIALGSVLGGIAVIAVGYLADRQLPRDRRDTLIASTTAVAALAVSLAQHALFPVSPLPDFDLPANPDSYESLLANSAGDVFVVGNPTKSADTWTTTSYANGFLLVPKPVFNVYSPLQYEAMANDLCTNAHGMACWESLDVLVEPDESTGAPLVDLLGISTLQVLVRPDFDEPPSEAGDPYVYAQVPEGWSEISRDQTAALWVRDEPVAGAGGIVWTSPGVSVSDVEESNREVTFTVDAVPDGGGTVVFSRLDWPGYSVTNAQLDEPTRGYLLTLDIPASSVGSQVTLSFTPAGWNIGLVALGASLVLTLVLAVGEPILKRQVVARSRSEA